MLLFGILMFRPEELLSADAPGTTKPEKEIDLSNSIFHGDSVYQLLPTWPDACVDHIITDPGYAIDMDNLDQQGVSLINTDAIDETHDVDQNLKMFTDMMPLFFRLLKEGGFCVLWCDAMHFRFLHDLATTAGFKVQRWPLLWTKTSPCKNQMAHHNFTKDYEIAIVLRKGNARLPSPVNTSRIMCPNDADKTTNPFAKPFRAWEFVYQVSIPGQVILEPFAGQGSGVVAGLKLDRRVLAIEKLEEQYNYLLKEVKEYWQGVFKNVKFV